MIESLTQFGVAGLMGALWVWERAHSRKRERELTEAHRHITGQEQQLDTLVRMVHQNTRALIRFEQTQKRVCDLLETFTRV